MAADLLKAVAYGLLLWSAFFLIGGALVLLGIPETAIWQNLLGLFVVVAASYAYFSSEWLLTDEHAIFVGAIWSLTAILLDYGLNVFLLGRGAALFVTWPPWIGYAELFLLPLITLRWRTDRLFETQKEMKSKRPR